jgi:hypothetical protein
VFAALNLAHLLGQYPSDARCNLTPSMEESSVPRVKYLYSALDAPFTAPNIRLLLEMLLWSTTGVGDYIDAYRLQISLPPSA